MKNINDIFIPTSVIGYHNGFYNDDIFINTELSKEHAMLYMIAQFYENKLINRQKLVAMFKNLKNGKLNRKINTFKCRITNEWFDSTGMYYILGKTYYDTLVKTRKANDLPLAKFLEYLNLYTNMKKNYNIDLVYFEYVEPLINMEKYDILNDFGLFSNELISFKTAQSRYDLSNKYKLFYSGCRCTCEEDERRNYERRYRPDEKEVKNEAKITLNNLKTHQRNPKNKLLVGDMC